MEGCQKVLNSILRLSNGFANAGAIPVLVQELGEEEIRKYLAERKAAQPSSARWVHEQMQLQSHSDLVDTFDAFLNMPERRTLSADWFWTLHVRCSMMTNFTVRLVARFRLRRARAVGSTYYTELLALYHDYWSAVEVELSANDLSERERRLQMRDARRLRYRNVTLMAANLPRLSSPFEMDDGRDTESLAFCACHPAQRGPDGDWLSRSASTKGKRAYATACRRWEHYRANRTWPEG